MFLNVQVSGANNLSFLVVSNDKGDAAIFTWLSIDHL